MTVKQLQKRLDRLPADASVAIYITYSERDCCVHCGEPERLFLDAPFALSGVELTREWDGCVPKPQCLLVAGERL